MAVFLIYYALLVLWIPLLWPAWRMTSGGRWWIRMAVAAGFVALLYEIWMTFVWAPAAPIRIDILLIVPVLAIFYGTAAGILFWAKWRKLGALLGLFLVLIGGGFTYKWIQIRGESERLREAFHAGNALLFEAKFRNRSTYESHFGFSGAAPASHPVGHWEAQAPSHYSRLIVNPAGRAWLFYKCGKTECHDGPEGSRVEGPGDRPGQWKARLKRRGGGEIVLLITRAAPDRLSVEIGGQAVSFVAAPPPINAQPAHESLVFLGSFTQTECTRQHAKVRQLWLWREDARLYAVGIFSTLVAGRRASFVSPVVMGEGTMSGDSWAFEWEREGRRGTASIALDGPNAALTLERERRETVQAVLERGAIFRDDAIELAPLTRKEDWTNWFEIVMTGHFSSADIPACPGSVSGLRSKPAQGK
jgi:hypothetical protein